MDAYYIFYKFSQINEQYINISYFEWHFKKQYSLQTIILETNNGS